MKKPISKTICALCVIGGSLILGGCRVVEIANNGEELACDSDGKPLLLSDGTIQTVKRGWTVYHNQHWMVTKADSLTASVEPGKIDFALNGLNAEPSAELTRLVDTSLTGAATLAAKIGAAALDGGASVPATETVAAAIKNFIAGGGDADKATVSCADGSCTITDGSISCTDGRCEDVK